MEETGVKRKLTVILAADVAGYSRLMGADEEATLKTLGAHREIIDGLIAGHDGRIFATAGDSVVAEFASPVEAVRAAISIQEELSVRNAELPENRRMHFRIGINLGDVMVQRENLLGDGVNVAARLEGLAVPGGICVSDMVYQSVEAKLDLAFEDLGAQSLKNIAKPVRAWRIVPGSAASTASSTEPPRSQFWPRLGVLAFAAIVVAVLGITGAAIWNSYLPGPAPADEGAPETGMPLPLPDKPSIAVLPFTNMSADPEQEYFSDGITEDIITDLSKVSGLFVIARHSTFKYKGKPVDVRDVARDLGVRYVLEGSVRKAGNKVRVTAQLIDAGTGNHLWAERYDRDLKDIFALQDEIAGKIAAALEVKLAAGEQEQVAHRYTDNLEAYDLFLRGREYQLRGTKGYPRARRMFEKAIELDPKFAAAYAELSYTHWEFQKRKGLERSFETAQRAVALDDTLPLARSRLAWAYLRKRQHEEAIREARRAIALDLNFAEGYAVLAEILNAADRPEEGIRLIRKAMRLNPYPPAKYLFVLGQSYYMMGQTQKAIATLERARNRNPEDKPPHMHLIILYGETGQMEKARAETEEILRLLPKESIELEEQICTYAPGPLKRFLEGLRSAGFPETSRAVAPSPAPAKPKAQSKTALPLPDKPSIAVLPFDNMSNDPEQEYFSDGITEDIITDLAKISGLFVVSRKAAFRYKGKDVGPAKVSRDLGVRYVLEGSVRKAGGKVRINAQLIDATTGGHLWAERYDRDLKDIFALQDEITKNIVAALEVKLTKGEQTQVWRRYTGNVEAYDFFLRSKAYRRRFTNEANLQRRRLLEKAIELDPKFAAAYAEMSWTYFFEWREFSSFSENPEGALDRGLEVAKKAVALDDSLPLTHTRLGWIYRWKSKNEKAVAEFERAIELDPNFAEAYTDLSSILFKVGKPEEAIGKAKTAIRLNPHASARFYHLLGNAYFWADSMRGTERYRKEALAAFKKALARDPDFAPSRRKLAAIYAEMGRMAEAEAEITEILRVSPGASMERMRRIWVVGKNHPDFDRGYERWLEAMRKAGLPETSKETTPAKPKAKSKTALPLPAKPSIAVLPFTNMSADPEQGYFSDGITDDLITDLAKISGLFVIARNSVFTYKGRAVKVQKVASDLGVRYVLEGSVRKAGSRVRINAQLVDATTGRHLWAERYDRDYKEIFTLQDEITAKIVSALAVELTDGEKAGRAARKQRANLQAHETFLRAKQYLWHFTTKDTAKAKELFEKAIRLDPNHARAHAALGRLHYNEWEIWGKERDRNLARALELGRKAAALDDSLAGAHLLLTQVYRFRREFEQSEIETDKALALDPTDADTLAGLGDVLRWSGRAPEAIGLLQKAMRLDPFYPAWNEFYLGHAYFLTGRYDQAIEALKRGAKRNSNYPAFPLYMAASYAMLGRTEEARAAAAEVLRINPDFTLQAFVAHVPYRARADVERDLAAMRKAGLPETSKAAAP